MTPTPRNVILHKHGTMTYDITLLTDKRWVKPENPDWYANQILTEDRLVQEALEAQGLKVNRVAWDNENVKWEETKFALFRTTWDYFDVFPKFLKWLDSTSSETKFINPIELIRWNMDKHYLNDLQEKGIPIPKTLFFEVGQTDKLNDAFLQSGWEKAVLKPAVSGSGRHTYKIDATNTSQHEAIFKELLENEAMLLQEFQEQIITKGEVALMVIDGKFTHAILKKAKAGDYRVQDDFGGTVHEYEPSTELIQMAEDIVAVCNPMPLYARVDIMWDNYDQPIIGELEIIEPELWFRDHPPAADLLARAIKQRYFN